MFDTSQPETLDLSPWRNPPPWKNTTTGVGPAPPNCGFAFQRSSTFRSCGP
jgi:hypothetical protein